MGKREELVTIRDSIDTMLYEFCKEHCPEKITAWYDDGGIYDWLAGLVDDLI